MNTQFYNPPYESVKSYFDKADIHEREKAAGDEVLAIIISLLWTFFHGINSYLLFWQQLPFIYSIIIHVVLTIVIILVTKILKQVNRDIRLLYVLSVASGGAGFFGACGALFSSILTIFYSYFSKPFSQWYNAIYPDFAHSRQQELYNSIVSGKDETAESYDVVSFKDIIVLGDESQKRRALTKMTDRFHPSFAQAFKLALQDESNAIRVQAASSIVKIESQFANILQQVELLEKKNPDDANLKLGLARYYDSFAFTGILDENRENENRNSALKQYKEYLEMRPNDVDARIEAGRLLLRSGKAMQAVELFQDFGKAGYDNNNIRYWLTESYYYAGMYEELRAQAAITIDKKDNDNSNEQFNRKITKAINFWGIKEGLEIYGS